MYVTSIQMSEKGEESSSSTNLASVPHTDYEQQGLLFLPPCADMQALLAWACGSSPYAQSLYTIGCSV